MKGFKKFLTEEKKIIGENFDEIVEEVSHLKASLTNKILELKHSSQDKFDHTL